jgi:hypothetical protein
MLYAIPMQTFSTRTSTSQVDLGRLPGRAATRSASTAGVSGRLLTVSDPSAVAGSSPLTSLGPT